MNLCTAIVHEEPVPPSPIKSLRLSTPRGKTTTMKTRGQPEATGQNTKKALFSAPGFRKRKVPSEGRAHAKLLGTGSLWTV